MKILLYSLFLFVITQSIFSQNIKVVGKISDIDGEAIAGAHIVIKNKKGGTVSNEKGFFEIGKISLKDTLKITHVAYNTFFHVFSLEQDYSSDSLVYIEISLTLKNQFLNPVIIESSKNNLVIKDANILVYDYELSGKDKFLILLDDTTKGELHLIDQNYNTVDKIKFRSNKFLKFQKDCFHNIYLELNDSLYQIFVYDTTISFYSAISQENFNSNLKNCEIVTDSIIVYSQYSKYNQQLNYYFINRISKKDNLLYQIFNLEKFINAQDVKKVQMSYGGINYMGDLTIGQLKQSRKYFEWTVYLNCMASVPIYNPIFTVRDSIYIFNLTHDKLIVFNKTGRYERECKVDFHHKTKLEKICADLNTNEIYGIVSNNGLISVGLIDLNTGSIINSFEIRNHLFPQKIEIRNGYIYFLDNTYQEKRKLYEIDIKY